MKKGEALPFFCLITKGPMMAAKEKILDDLFLRILKDIYYAEKTSLLDRRFIECLTSFMKLRRHCDLRGCRRAVSYG
jgi:hypothetical protein